MKFLHDYSPLLPYTPAGYCTWHADHVIFPKILRCRKGGSPRGILIDAARIINTGSISSSPQQLHADLQFDIILALKICPELKHGTALTGRLMPRSGKSVRARIVRSTSDSIQQLWGGGFSYVT